MEIDALLRGTHPHHEQQQARADASVGYKMVSEMLQVTRQEAGKDTTPNHYANEARLINYAAFGEWKAVERDELSKQDLRLIEKLQARNVLFLAKGKPYDERKALLVEYARQYRQRRAALSVVPSGVAA